MKNKNKLKKQNWEKKRLRLKYRLKQSNISSYPRLVIYRSNTNIYAQLIDDKKNTTILSSSSIDKELKESIAKASNKIEKSRIVGDAITEKMKKAKIDTIILDRNGYKYHGRIKALSDAIRSSDINI